MKYVVATHSFLILVDFEDDWTVKDYKILNQGYHFGIALLENNSDGFHNRNSSPSLGKEPGFITYRGGENVHEQTDMALWTYTANGELIGTSNLSSYWGDVHQLSCANNGLYLTNTKFNRLVYQSGETEITHEFVFHGLNYDRNHLNSVFPCEDQIFVILHNRAYSQSELVILNHDLASGFKVEKVLSLWNVGCHNVYLDDSVLIYNASQAHELVIVNLKEDQIQSRIPFTGWHSKGMSVTDKFIVVGLSEHAFRDKRSTAEGRIAVVDRETFNPIKIIDLNFEDLPHPIGNVNEIRCVSGGELAQAGAHKPTIDWDQLEFSKRNRVLHYLDRLRISTLLPLRRVKGYIRIRI